VNGDGKSVKRTAEVTYRRAEEADLPRAFAVFRAALNAYLVRAGQEAVPDDDEQSPSYRHFLEHDGERFWVAEADTDEFTGGHADPTRAGGREIVGWGCGLLRGDWWFLSSLFVLPEAQGIGVGARLFELAGTGAPAEAVRATITDSLQPISNTLYARRGLLSREVVVGFGGRPREGLRRPRLGSLEPGPLTPAAIPELREIDAAAGGVDRGVDHAFYLTSGRRGWLFRRRGRAVAYLMTRGDGWIGPAASVRAADIEPVVAFGVAALARHGPIEKVRAGVTGRCEGAQRALWEAGLVFDGTPGLLLSSRLFGRLDRYVPASYGMF